MKVITIESESFKQLTSNTEKISKKLDEKFKDYSLRERWLDNPEVYEVFKVSIRTIIVITVFSHILKTERKSITKPQVREYVDK